MNQSDSLPLVTESSCGTPTTGPVPVFNCIVILRTCPDTRRIAGRVASLPSITAEGNTERDVLLAITRKFKALMKESLEGNQPVAWLDPPQKASAGEVERFVPVHL